MLIVGKGFTIAPIVETDAVLEQILEVYRQCEDFLSLGPVAHASMEMVRADLALSHQEGCTFCAITENTSGAMVGVLDFTPSGWEGDPQKAFLMLLMIAAPHRGKGLGEQVVCAVEEEIRRDGRARVIDSGVQVNNPKAIRFWQRMGFSIVSGPINHPDGTTAFDLRKDL